MNKANLYGIVLAGGCSRRMGTNKALIEILGVPMMIRQISKIRSLLELYDTHEILVSVRQTGELELPYGARYVEDLKAGEGPLMGIYSCLLQLASGHAVVLGVDMPRMDPPTLNMLVEQCEPGVGVVPVYGKSDFYEPLAAVYPVEIIPLIQQFLHEGKRSMQDLVREGIQKGILKKFEIPKQETVKFMNVNCPQDLTEYADHS